MASVRHKLGYNIRQITKNATTVASLMEEIEKNYKPKGSAVFINLQQKYDSLSLNKCASIVDVATQLRQVRSELLELSLTCTISEPAFVCKFLMGLTDNFRQFISNIFQQYTLIDEAENSAHSFDFAVMLAEREERLMETRVTQDEVARVFMSTDKNSNKNPPDYCSHCKRLYHTSQSCWKLHPELRSKPSKKRKITRDDQEQLHQIMMAITNHKEKSPLSDVWILDSGAEEHVCCRKEDFVHINPAPGQAIVGPRNVKHFAEGRGTVKLECVVKGKTAWLTLTDVLFIPTAGVNLLAVASIQDKGGDVVFRRNGSAQIICPKLIFTAIRKMKDCPVQL
ncbi:hypothetical protein K3495_g2306 [Podosphaera aphanis]|nr:hypothetical protein K3495_g2306 [Podosphaera aphanis]